MGKVQDITGQQFGELTALYRNIEVQKEKHSSASYWHCKCSCGKEVDVIISSLKNGHTKSCGHLAKLTQIQPLKITPGERYGRLTVLQKVESSTSRNSLWLCQCDCGNTKIITGHCLAAGLTKSCGCWQRESRSIIHTKDITGQQFGALTAIKRLDRKDGKTYNWLCKCKCGNECITSLDNLVQGNKVSCGCLNMSNGELTIKRLLDENNIKYEYQKTFNSCKGLNPNYYLRFDFYLLEYNTIIEYDGAQHFSFGTGWNTKEQYEATHQRDLIKNQWCKENGIVLKRIPYKVNLRQLTIDDIMNDKYILKEDYYEKYSVCLL